MIGMKENFADKLFVKAKAGFKNDDDEQNLTVSISTGGSN
jgi:hypothetical protein